jgi:hypothetical protein
MSEKLKEYEYMWNGSSVGWVLVRFNEADGGVEYSIYNKKTKMVCIIEDDEIHKMVCNKLLSLGTEVLPNIPQSEFSIHDIELENNCQSGP